MIKTCYFGGGCFWCTEAIFKNINGVISIYPGYMGGDTKNPTYKQVCEGYTGHAEIVKIDYNSSIISFKDLLSVFFSTHDPTTLNRQGNDIGTQYRSIIFCENEDQIKSTNFYIKKLENLKVYNSGIVTEVLQKEEFYIAEADHLNYYNQNKSQLYCRLVIEPKLKKFMLGFKDKLKK